MSGIAEAMSGITSGKRSGGIASRMEGHEPDPEPEKEEGDGISEHLKAMHDETGGKHMHVHEHEGGYTSHHVDDDGNVEGPDEHESTDDLKRHMDRFFNQERREPHEDHSDGLM